MSTVKIFTNENFAEATSKGVVLVDFWAEWCGPCKMLLPILEQVAAEVDGIATVGKVNVDDCKELAIQFKVSNIPSLFILKDGEIINHMVGVKDKTTLVNALKNA